MDVRASGLYQLATVRVFRLEAQPYLLAGLGANAALRSFAGHAGAGTQLTVGSGYVNIEWGRNPGRERNTLALGIGFGTR